MKFGFFVYVLGQMVSAMILVAFYLLYFGLGLYMYLVVSCNLNQTKEELHADYIRKGSFGHFFGR